tara:strand:- start:88 stop:282 length:195 start_codon:yes stop_codon:yes gene_type:complete
MKEYFLGFDVWGEGFNKFFFGVVEIDLSDGHLNDTVKAIALDKWGFKEFDYQFKVTALNNIDTQ